MGFLWTLIIALILTVILTAIYRFVKTLFDITHPEKKVTLETEKEYFQEANTNDKEIEKGTVEGQSVSMLYEEMCINDPLHYMGNPIVEEVLRKYKDLIKGRILDPTGENIPSEFIDGKRNPDYMRYLRNQRKKLKASGLSTSWMDREYSRTTEANKYDKEKDTFVQSLVDFGIPTSVIDYAVTDDRIESYKPDDWNNLKQAIKNYLEKADTDVVCEYLSLFEGDTLLDELLFDKYVILRKHEIDMCVSKYVIDEDITEEQLYKIIDLVEEKAYSSEDAVAKVFEDSSKAFKKEILRDMYRRKVARR